MADVQNTADAPPPNTPDSPLTASSSQHNINAPATIDDLTLALANFSRVTSPELPSTILCCCGQEDCDNTKSWLAVKSNLENRLILSAEVGQALLQRHEAYVRRQENVHDDPIAESIQFSRGDQRDGMQESTESLMDELIREKAALSKRLNQALVNNEVAEVSHKALLLELQEARDAISRLTIQNARSAGWDTRLTIVMQERDDLQQERDSEAHRARRAENRVTALNTRLSKLQLEVQRLRESVEKRTLHRLESSESVLQEARAHLESLQKSHVDQTARTEGDEIKEVLHSLVEDNDGLKRDNAELHRLLAESREDCDMLQEQLEEQRASPSRIHTPKYKSLFLTRTPSAMNSPGWNTSMDRKARRHFEPLTPETDCFPLSSSAPQTPSDSNFAPIPRLPPSMHTYGDEEFSITIEGEQPQRPNHSRGVQTDRSQGTLPTLLSPHDPRSESSSVTDSQSTNMTVLVERVASLLTRITQADALSLTNRLKRQNLKGADVGHLSRVTISAIVSEAGNLRAHFRHLLEDDRIVTACTRKDLRALFKLFKDTFVEMGQMRVTLNDVILDPSIAGKLRETTLNPSKAETAGVSISPASGGWMAPISKLFGTSSGDASLAPREPTPATTEDGRGRRAKSRPPHRVIPKLGPALSASTTTVNVEFSGGGVGRAVTSTFQGQDKIPVSATSSGSPYHAPTSVMGIFAGAPQSTTQDSWVVLQKQPRTAPSTRSNKLGMPSSLGKDSAMNSRGANRMSRNVDAIIGPNASMDEETDAVPPLLQRTLRRRGLSDSSIHSTFLSQSDIPPDDRDGPSPKVSMLRSLSRTVQNFRFTTPLTSGPQTGSEIGPAVPIAIARPQQAQSTNDVLPQDRVSSSFSGILPTISSWAGLGTESTIDEGSPPFFAGSFREESLLRQSR